MTKIFHYARFDVAVLYNAFGVMPEPVYLHQDRLEAGAPPTPTGMDWKDLVSRTPSASTCPSSSNPPTGRPRRCSDAQLAYAASDVLHLHALRQKLDVMLAREGRTELAGACFGFVPTRARLDLKG